MWSRRRARLSMSLGSACSNSVKRASTLRWSVVSTAMMFMLGSYPAAALPDRRLGRAMLGTRPARSVGCSRAGRVPAMRDVDPPMAPPPGDEPGAIRLLFVHEGDDVRLVGRQP